jgi:fibronectin type 3 domain-containing protein
MFFDVLRHGAQHVRIRHRLGAVRLKASHSPLGNVQHTSRKGEPAAAATTANSSGNYSFTGVANGSYAVTPSNTGYTFTPSTQGVTVSGSNVTGVNFTAVVAHSVTLSWTASTSTDVSGYNVYRGTVSGGPYTILNVSLVPGTTYTDSDVQSGQTYYYVVTAVNSSGVESTDSNQASAVIP